MTEELIDHFEPHLASIKLIPSSGGVFEVSVDGTLIFSRARLGRFPKFEELREKLEPLLQS